MGKKSFVLLNTLIVLGLTFMSSCSSPEKEGSQLGKTYTDCLGSTNTFKQSFELLDKKADCDNKIKTNWEQAKEKYKNDATKWKSFIDAFGNATKTTVEELNLNLTKLIATEIEGKLWVREDDSSKDFYLCSFENGVLKFLNSKGAFEYELKGNVLSFDDDRGTSGKVIVKDDKLSLSDTENNVSLNYRLADNKDKIIGKWSVSGSLLVTLARNGKCTLGGSGFSTKTIPYTYDDDVLDIKGAGAYKIKTDNWNVLPWGKQPFSRIKSDQPKDLRVLFGHSSIGESVSGVSSTSNSENWDQMLNDYEEYVNEYLKFYKKAIAGDMSALSEYQELLDKATALETSMTAAQNDDKLSAAQISRLMKIQTKMLQGAIN